MISLRHLAVGFVPLTRRPSVEAAGGVMDAAAASCSYMMEGDFQLCWHQLSRSQRGVMGVYSAAPLSTPLLKTLHWNTNKQVLSPRVQSDSLIHLSHCFPSVWTYCLTPVSDTYPDQVFEKRVQRWCGTWLPHGNSGKWMIITVIIIINLRQEMAAISSHFCRKFCKESWTWMCSVSRCIKAPRKEEKSCEVTPEFSMLKP